jgi:hypothetical protein
MGKTVLLAKEEPGGAAGFSWEQGGEEGAIEIDAQWANHLMAQTGNDFFIVQPKVKKAEKPVEHKEPVKPKPKAKEKLEPATDDDLTQALKVASSITHQTKD